jgi:hypothetical protein
MPVATLIDCLPLPKAMHCQILTTFITAKVYIVMSEYFTQIKADRLG